MPQLTGIERRELNVDPSRWAWHTTGSHRAPGETSGPEPGPEQIAAHYLRSAGAVTPTVATTPRASRLRQWMRSLLILATAWSIISGPVLLTAPLRQGKPGATIFMGCLIAIVAILWSVYWATRPKARRFTPPLPVPAITAPEFPLPSMTFGSPGSIGSAATPFGADEVRAGVRGEVSTARLLDLLLDIPGVNVFHGLRFPGSETADVDHAVVHGQTVYLIDSKQYRPGVYSWGADREILGPAGTRYKNHMAAARAGYEQILERGVRVHAMVVIHGDGATVGPRDLQDGVRLTGAQWALAYLGDALMAEHRSGWSEYDNSRIVGRLLLNLK
jgi:hypothetical protein